MSCEHEIVREPGTLEAALRQAGNASGYVGRVGQNLLWAVWRITAPEVKIRVRDALAHDWVGYTAAEYAAKFIGRWGPQGVYP